MENKRLTKQQKLKRDIMTLKYQNEGNSMATGIDELISHLNDDSKNFDSNWTHTMVKPKVSATSV